jgi:hypothetical protein
MVVVASFSAEGGQMSMLIQPTMGSGGVASGENRASMSVVVDDDSVSGCCRRGETTYAMGWLKWGPN